MTVQQYLDKAYAKSKKNQPGKIVAESSEGLELVNRVVRMFCQIGVRVNPEFFMGDADVVYESSESAETFGPGWVRPSTAEAVLMIQMDDGTEVSVVPWNDRLAEVLKPSVYRRGQAYRPAGNANDPATNETLTFSFSRRPVDAIALADDVDVIFPEAYAELAAYELAIVFAIKDGRREEVGELATERDTWLRMYLTFLQHETMNETRRWDNRFNIPSAMPIVLAGGSSVELPNGGA